MYKRQISIIKRSKKNESETWNLKDHRVTAEDVKGESILKGTKEL